MNPLTNMKNVVKLSQQELGNIGKSSWHDQYKDSAWIYVGGLPFDLTEGDIICIFSHIPELNLIDLASDLLLQTTNVHSLDIIFHRHRYGEVVNINLIRAKDTGKSKGFCFLCFEDQRSTILAVDNLNGIKILNRTIRVDHVAAYKAPKDHKKDTVETKKLHDEGCAPKPVIPIMPIKKEDNTQRETFVDQIEQDIKLPARLPIYPAAIKQEALDTETKKEKKKSKKKKKKRSKNSDTDDSSDSDRKKEQQEKEEWERKQEEMRKKMEEREEKRQKIEEIRRKREEKEKRRFGAKKRKRSKTPEKEPTFRKRDVSPSIPTRWK